MAEDGFLFSVLCFHFGMRQFQWWFIDVGTYGFSLLDLLIIKYACLGIHFTIAGVLFVAPISFSLRHSDWRRPQRYRCDVMWTLKHVNVNDCFTLFFYSNIIDLWPLKMLVVAVEPKWRRKNYCSHVKNEQQQKNGKISEVSVMRMYNIM